MNIRSIFLGTLLFAFFFSSCSKSSETPAATFSVEGTYKGTFSYDQGVSTITLPQYFSFDLQRGGTMTVESQDAGVKYTANGTWTISGTTVTCKYTYTNSVLGVQLAQTSIGEFDSNTGKLSGKWYNTNNVSQKGTFTMTHN